jgi:hypothetical protein
MTSTTEEASAASPEEQEPLLRVCGCSWRKEHGGEEAAAAEGGSDAAAAEGGSEAERDSEAAAAEGGSEAERDSEAAPAPAFALAPRLASASSRAHLHSGYYGRVAVPVRREEEGDVCHLECTVRLGTKRVLVRVIDAAANGLDVRKSIPRIADVQPLPAAKLSAAENAYWYTVALLATQQLDEEHKEERAEASKEAPLPALAPAYAERLKRDYPGLAARQRQPADALRAAQRQALEHCMGVDVLFAVVEFLEFLYRTTGVAGVNQQTQLLCLVNNPGLDNAYWSGGRLGYMTFGNGQSAFLPLTGLDVAGHELGHGVVQGLGGLKYQGLSGALNEALADILGAAFERHVYLKYNGNATENDDLRGGWDWTVGEDFDAAPGGYLRNMAQPESAQPPQPSRYGGAFFVNPASSFDYGGVHFNSGIINAAFVRIARQTRDVEATLCLFLGCARGLCAKSQTPTFHEFAQALLQQCRPEHRAACQRALQAANLARAAVPAWRRRRRVFRRVIR